MDDYEADKTSDKLITKAREKDLIVTEDLKQIVSLGSGKLEGLDFRIKGKDNLSRKLASKASAKNISISKYSK